MQTQAQTQLFQGSDGISKFHTRTKHIEIEHDFIREKILDNTVDTLEVRSEENITFPQSRFPRLSSY